MSVRQVVYRDPKSPIEERVADLLGRMTTAEKAAQLGSVWGVDLVDPQGSLSRDRAAATLSHGIGEVTRLGGSTNLRPDEVARAANMIQRFLVEETPFGIPAIVHEETLHGLTASGAPVFQQAIGAAATFDPELLERVASTIRRRMQLVGAHHALAPVLDIACDPRWGRIEETYGEDPYLSAAMGISYIHGIQGDGPTPAVLATGKHLVGHGLAEGGLNQAPAHVGWRELRDEQLLPFEAAIRAAGLASVMPAYCEVDGVPCHASTELLSDLLRREWGFDGLVVSDYVGIEQIVRHHRLTPDMGHAAALALTAGVDLELPETVAYAAPLARELAEGRIDEGVLDRAVSRVLAAKFRLGLFEQPYVVPPSRDDIETLEREERDVGLELARESLVLVENDGILPIEAGSRRIAVIGPHAASVRELLGDYSHLVHLEALREMHPGDTRFGEAIAAHIGAAGEIAGRTILDALRARLGEERVTHAPGTGLHDGTDEEIAVAVALARECDVAIVVVGERSGLTADSTTGEFRDRQDLGLFGRQQDLLEAVVATGTPVVLIVVSGRPLALTWAAEHCAAILLAWVPGDYGPDAIAEVLAGDVVPGGRLPVSVPRAVGQVPLTYRHHPSGGRSNPHGDRVDGSVAPLWPFGFGRSYTTFGLTDLSLSSGTMVTDGGKLTASVSIANLGVWTGDEVVQLYLRDEEASVARPVIELCAFRRVRLAPGERAEVFFTLCSEQLAFTGVDYRRVVEPGRVRLLAGTSSGHLPLEATFELVGRSVELRRRSWFVAPTWIRLSEAPGMSDQTRQLEGGRDDG